MKLLREPLVHFLVMGAAIFGIYGLMGGQEVERQEQVITITAGEIGWLTDTWKKTWHRPPTIEERENLIKHYLRELILYREALAMGLDRDDIVIRRRLVQKLEFLTQDVVSPQPPTENELHQYYETHIDRYHPPDLITLTHVILDPNKRGDETFKDAETIKAQLIRLNQAPDDTLSFGDLKMLKNYYPKHSEAELAKFFGRGFAQQVFELNPQEWHGPVVSEYGVHLVYVHERQKSKAPTFSELKAKVRQDWENNKREQLYEKFIASLIARYDVTIEEVPIAKKWGTHKEGS
jgi:hypothetical protein